MDNSIVTRGAYLQSQAGDEVAAVNWHNTARHVRTGIRGEQKKRALELSQLAEPALRNSFDQRLAGVTAKEVVIELGLEISGRKRVNPYAVTRPFERQCLGHLHDPGF